MNVCKTCPQCVFLRNAKVDHSCLSASLVSTQVADRWQAPLALTALSSVLCTLQPDLFPIAAAYSLPETLQTAPAFAQVKARALESLLAVFGDAVAVATSHTLVREFVKLPAAAVQTLLRSDALVTDAEATVLLLLSEWCDGPQGDGCSERKLRQLNSSIRYGRLSAPYLTDLFYSLHTPRLSTAERLELLYFQSLSTQSQAAVIDRGDLRNCAPWYLPRRRAPSENPVTLLPLTLRFSEAELHRLLQHVQDKKDGKRVQHFELSSAAGYAHGFWFEFVLYSSRAGKLCCGIFPYGVSSLLDGNEKINLNHSIICSCSAWLMGSTVASDRVLLTDIDCPINRNGLGSYVAKATSEILEPMDKLWWQPYVVDGLLSIEAIVVLKRS